LIRISSLLLALFVVGCASMGTKQLNDGELALPSGYKSWPKFLAEVQRPDAKQVRDIYVNPVGSKTAPGGTFPNGTVFVMENYAAALGPDGAPKTGPDGKLVKDKLLRVFVMGKGEGWGAAAPEGLKNGNWVYASYLADGKPGPEDPKACRSCHLPVASKDFVHRYDEYFQKRSQFDLNVPKVAAVSK
jgi:Cytochrome P460